MGSKKTILALSVVLLIMIAGILPAMAQQQTGWERDRDLVQVSGVIRSANSDGVVPYVTIRNLSFRDQAFVANHQGYFSFVAHVGDTLYFTSLGYAPIQLVVPAVPDRKYTADVRMSTDVIELEAIQPYPWASIDEFNMAFMSLEVADDDVLVAKKNLSMESLAAMMAVIPRNAQEMQTFNANQNHIGLSNKAINQRMANPLLSPFAWGNFIRQISEGSRSRSKNKW